MMERSCQREQESNKGGIRPERHGGGNSPMWDGGVGSQPFFRLANGVLQVARDGARHGRPGQRGDSERNTVQATVGTGLGISL